MTKVDLLEIIQSHSIPLFCMTQMGMRKVKVVEITHSNWIQEFCEDMKMTYRQEFKFRKLAGILQQNIAKDVHGMSIVNKSFASNKPTLKAFISKELHQIPNIYNKLTNDIGITDIYDLISIDRNDINEICSELNLSGKHKIKIKVAIAKLQRHIITTQEEQKIIIATGMYKPKIITTQEEQKMQKLNCIANKLNSIQSTNSENYNKILQQSDKMAQEIDNEFTQMMHMLRTKQQQLHAKLENAKNENIHKLQIAQNQVSHHLKQAEHEKSQQKHLIMNKQPTVDREKQICQITDKIVRSIIYKDLTIKKPEFSLMSNVDAIKQNISPWDLDVRYPAENDDNDMSEMKILDEKNDENNTDSKFMVRFSNKDNTESILVENCEVSNYSDLFDGDDMMGIIIYQYDGKTEWELNGIKCKSGFIYLCKSDKLNNITSHPMNTMHACCYKYLFGVDPDYRKIVGAGCGFRNGIWKYNSSTFCAPENRKKKLAQHYGTSDFKDNWHDDDRGMHEIEKKLLDQAVTKWTKFSQEVKTISWSWWRYDWMPYDKGTIRYVEYEFRKYLQKNEKIKNDTYYIELNTKFFKTNNKVKDYTYKIYFSSPNISLDSDNIHSRNNPKWKND
eukprot:153892_1